MPQRRSVGHFRDQDNMTENKWSDSQLKKIYFGEVQLC